MNYEKKAIVLLLLLISSFFITAEPALAEIGISPERFELKLEKNISENRSVFVENRNSFPVQVFISTDAPNELLEISTPIFTLTPQTLQEVKFSITPKKTFSTTLNIAARETAGENLLVQSGIRIPVAVKVAGNANKWLYSIGGALVLTFGIFFLRKRRRTTH